MPTECSIVLQEKAAALAKGRQKRIQIIDGQQVEVLTGEFGEEAMDEDDEDYEEEDISIDLEGQERKRREREAANKEKGDSSEYVVLEVIQVRGRLHYATKRSEIRVMITV